MTKPLLFILSAGALMMSCTSRPSVQPPLAAQQPETLRVSHSPDRIDPWFWLNLRENPEVINYLNAENEYLDTMLAHTKPFQDKLFAEMKGRIKEKDSGAPWQYGDYYYYNRYDEGGEYAIFCRKKGSMDATEEILIDGNAMGMGLGYFSYWTTISHDQKVAAVMVDTVGRRFYDIRFKNLETGEWLPDEIMKTTGNLVFSTDNKTVYYSRQDEATLRSDRVLAHVMGTSSATDKEIYYEADQTLAVGLDQSKDAKYTFVSSGRTDANVVRFFANDKPFKQLTLIEPIAADVEYSVEHHDGNFIIRTNKNAVNFRLVSAPVSKPGSANWIDLVPQRDGILLNGFSVFKDFLVVDDVSAGLSTLRIIRWDDRSQHSIQFDEPAYYAGLGVSMNYESAWVRYNYTSMTTPSSQFDYHMVNREKVLVKQQEIPGGFNPALYKTERLMVPARDGRLIPLSVVYRVDTFKQNGGNPGWVYGYGSYGASMYAAFSISRISLLDRGFVYAIAHIRGGQEMGGDWYNEGKMMKKINTFNDFIDCSEYLVNQGYVAKDKLFASGGSAGGLLIGAVSNMAPDLYRGLIAAVPFVDVVTTMLDESIPLTTFEWKEWGDPRIKAEYDYMLSYSPYDNVEAKNYPAMLVLTGLHDSQVQYWEPAKWVSKLRVMKTDRNPLYLHTNMEAGHGGASGRFRSLKETALQYAFVMDLIGIEK